MPWSETAAVGSRGKSKREDIRRESRRGDIGWKKGEKMQVVIVPGKKQESNHECEKVLIIPLRQWYKMHEN